MHLVAVGDGGVAFAIGACKCMGLIDFVPCGDKSVLSTPFTRRMRDVGPDKMHFKAVFRH